MIAECLRLGAPTQIYLVPVDHLKDAASTHAMIDTIVKWKPRALGVFTHRDIVGHERSELLMREVYRSLISKTDIQNFYIDPSCLGYDLTLNLALTIKSETHTTAHRVMVFH